MQRGQRPEHTEPNRYADANALRARILSDRGPTNGGCRLVLLALLQFGGSSTIVWPSQKTIASMTGQSLRTVRTHLNTAERERWFTRGPGRPTPGQRWISTIYMLHTPEQAANSAAINAQVEQAANFAKEAARIAD